MKMEVGI